jgi:cyclase
MEDYGAGELLVTSIDREGTHKGYDLDITRKISEVVNIPVIANGGAGSLNDMFLAVKEGKASAVAAGSMFVFWGKLKGILINYPGQDDLRNQIYMKI